MSKEKRNNVVCGIAIIVVVVLVLLAIAVVIAVPVAVVFSRRTDSNVNPPGQGAVSLDSAVCADMAADILRRGGSAVDATITGMLCSGAVQPQSSGLGGGGFMVIRLNNGSVYVLNFGETAPLAADENIFNGNSTLSVLGGLSVGVPGELRGMERAHKLFGNLPWKALFDPVIGMCRNGFNITVHTANALQSLWDRLSENTRDLYQNEDGGIKVVGDQVTLPQLADTLETISRDGANAFYNDGRIARSIVDTVNASGGIMTLEDLRTYAVKMEEPLKTQHNGHTFFAPPSPAGGPAFLFMLSLMDLYRHNSTSDRNLVYQRLVEAFKFAFAERTRLADPFCNDPQCESDSREILESQRRLFNATYVSEIWARIRDDQTQNTSYYNPRYSPTEDAGTSHMSVLAPSGDAVSVTTTVNYRFGSKLMTDTGIVLNNEMGDFTAPNFTSSGLPPSNINFVRPGKRPLSSTTPTIAITEADGGPRVSLVIGASGGTSIPTAVAQAIIRNLTFDQSLSMAIESKRLHHRLLPDVVRYEVGFSQEILTFLEGKGHVTQSGGTSAVVQGILVGGDGCVAANADSRKQGKGIVLNQKEQCSDQ